MPDASAEGDALQRLEAALDRIARHQAAQPGAAPAVPAADTAPVAARLDRLITQLRDALDAPAAAARG